MRLGCDGWLYDEIYISEKQHWEERVIRLVDVKYPVLQSPVEYVPYGLLIPHETQAKVNHGGQSLERLKERGGLSYNEMLCIIEDRKFEMVSNNEARNKVLVYV